MVLRQMDDHFEVPKLTEFGQFRAEQDFRDVSKADNEMDPRFVVFVRKSVREKRVDWGQSDPLANANQMLEGVWLPRERAVRALPFGEVTDFQLAKMLGHQTMSLVFHQNVEGSLLWIMSDGGVGSTDEIPLGGFVVTIFVQSMRSGCANHQVEGWWHRQIILIEIQLLFVEETEAQKIHGGTLLHSDFEREFLVLAVEEIDPWTGSR